MLYLLPQILQELRVQSLFLCPILKSNWNICQFFVRGWYVRLEIIFWIRHSDKVSYCTKSNGFVGQQCSMWPSVSSRFEYPLFMICDLESCDNGFSIIILSKYEHWFSKKLVKFDVSSYNWLSFFPIPFLSLCPV